MESDSLYILYCGQVIPLERKMGQGWLKSADPLIKRLDFSFLFNFRFQTFAH